MKIKCPVCSEIIDSNTKECIGCGSKMQDIRNALLRQKANMSSENHTVYTSVELEEMFEFEKSGTGYAIKEYFGLESRVFVPGKYKGRVVNAIAPNAFEGSDVVEVNLPLTVRKIGNDAFADCFKLKKINVPVRCKTISANAFANCISLTSIEIPDSVIELGKYAFSGCVNLAKLRFPAKLEIIEEGVFENCSALPHIILPIKTKAIRENAFYNCKGIMKIKFNSGLISIGESAFGECISLERVLLSETVTTISDNAFQNCKKLKAVYIGKNLVDLTGTAFYGCNSLSAFKVNEENQHLQTNGNCITNKNGNVLILGCKKSILPDTLVRISRYAYSGYSFEDMVFIPKTVISVEDKAFYNTSVFEIKISHTAKPRKWGDNWLLGENVVTWGV